MAYYNVNSENGDLIPVAGGTLYADIPIGTIIGSGVPASNPPAGYLYCDGRAVSRTAYAALFAEIGTAFGAGDGSTTFNLPDGREATFKGAGLTGLSNNHYDADGLTVGEFIDDRLQDHKHYAYSGNNNGWNVYIDNVSSGKVVRADSTEQNNGKTTGEMTTGRTGATTEVKAFGVNFFIKAKNVAVPADFMSKVDDAVSDAMNQVSSISNAITRDTTHTSNMSEIAAYKQARVAQIKCYLTFQNIQSNTWNTVGTVVNSLKPVMETALTVSEGAVVPKIALFRLNTDGKIQVWGNNIVDGDTTRISATYLTAS